MTSDRITLRTPGGRAEGDEAWHAAIVTPAASPFRWEFRYLMDVDDESGETRIVCLGTVVTPNVDDPRELEGQDHVPLSPAVLAEWADLERLARAHMARLLGGKDDGELPNRVVIERRRKRPLTDAFLSEIADRFRAYEAQGISPTQRLMREEGVSRRTVGNWLQEARSRGLLEQAGRGSQTGGGER